MSWSDFWRERAKKTAARRRRNYAVEAPSAVSRKIQQDSSLGLTGSLNLASYVLIGSPLELLRLLWLNLADRDTPKRRRKIDSLANELKSRLSEDAGVTGSFFQRRIYSRDLAVLPGFLEKLLFKTTPFLVIQPSGEDDIRHALSFALEKRMAVFPRGISSSAFGATIPTANGLVLDLSPMNRILRIDQQALTATVQPGTRWSDLATELEQYGLAPITTPSSRFSTVAGWASTGGIGIGSFGHGHFSKAVVSARVVFADSQVKELHAKDGLLNEFLGSEGQLGIFSELTLKIREKPAYGRPRLIYADSADRALKLIDEIESNGNRPAHLAFYDRNRLAEQNVLYADRSAASEEIFENRDALLMQFESPESEAACMKRISTDTEDNSVAAHYLWAMRYFPFEAQRIGPNLLAAEVRFCRNRIGEYLKRARRIAKRLSTELATEIIFDDGVEDLNCVVILSFTCNSRRRIDYLLRLLVVHLLSDLALRMEGRPYGVGIWNTPLQIRARTENTRKQLQQLKADLDPKRLLNPNKYYGIRTRFWNLPGLILNPSLHAAAMKAAALAAPLLGIFVKKSSGMRPWRAPSAQIGRGKRLLKESAQRCTYCGSCISICPAYFLTGDELVTARAKLRMAEALSVRDAVSAEEALTVLQCLHCGLCEEVCQTRLPLRDCYDVLEGLITDRYGSADDRPTEFSKKVDENRDLIIGRFGIEPSSGPGVGAGGLTEWNASGRGDE